MGKYVYTSPKAEANAKKYKKRYGGYAKGAPKVKSFKMGNYNG